MMPPGAAARHSDDSVGCFWERAAQTEAIEAAAYIIENFRRPKSGGHWRRIEDDAAPCLARGVMVSWRAAPPGLLCKRAKQQGAPAQMRRKRVRPALLRPAAHARLYVDCRASSYSLRDLHAERERCLAELGLELLVVLVKAQPAPHVLNENLRRCPAQVPRVEVWHMGTLPQTAPHPWERPQLVPATRKARTRHCAPPCTWRACASCPRAGQTTTTCF